MTWNPKTAAVLLAMATLLLVPISGHAEFAGSPSAVDETPTATATATVTATTATATATVTSIPEATATVTATPDTTATATATPVASPTATSTPSGDEDSEDEDNDGGDRPHNHGWYVSEAAHDFDEDFDGNHGEWVSDVAHEDWGQRDRDHDRIAPPDPNLATPTPGTSEEDPWDGRDKPRGWDRPGHGGDEDEWRHSSTTTPTATVTGTPATPTATPVVTETATPTTHWMPPFQSDDRGDKKDNGPKDPKDHGRDR